MILRSKFVIISSTSLIFIGCLNTCTSNDHVEINQHISVPRIWPNISDDHAFLQYPGLSGSGGLDFSFYDAFAKIVKKTKGIPFLIASHGEYKLLQIALMAAVGGLVTGLAVLLVEAYFFKVQHQNLLEHHDDAASYGPPLLTEYGAPPVSIAHGVPSPPSSHGAPSSPSTYEAPSPPITYEAASPPSSYGVPPPSTYGAPSPSTGYTVPSSPPSTYGAPSPPTGYGSPPSPPSTYGVPNSLSNSYEIPPALLKN